MKKKIKTVRNESESNLSRLLYDIKGESFYSVYECIHDINVVYNNFISILKFIIDTNCPTIKTNVPLHKKIKNWVSPDVIKCKNELIDLFWLKKIQDIQK